MAKKKLKSVPRFLKRLFPSLAGIVDSQDRIVVTVKETDCRDAKSNQPENCAMARAVKRQYKADGAVIGLKSSYVVNGNTAIRFQTPVTVQREITSFDRHNDFAPGEYSLSPVSPSRSTPRQKPSETSGGHEHLKHRITHKRTVRVRVLN